MKKQLLATIALSLGSLLWTAVAEAATVAVTSSSKFQSLTTNVATGNFNSVPTPNDGGTWGGYPGGLSGYAGLLGVAFTTPNDTPAVNVNSAYFYGPNDLSAPYAVNSTYTGAQPDVLNILLPAVQTAFFLDFTTLFNSTTATFTLSNGFTTTISPTVAYPNAPAFLGFVSSVPFSEITLSVPSQQSWVVASFGYGSWNGVSPIPEPATWAMMLIGFAGLGYAALRRNGRRILNA